MFVALHYVTMKALAENFRRAIKDAGYKNPTEFARDNGLTEVSVRAHANGHRGIRVSTARRYAALLKNVKWQDLVTDADRSDVVLLDPESSPETRALMTFSREMAEKVVAKIAPLDEEHALDLKDDLSTLCYETMRRLEAEGETLEALRSAMPVILEVSSQIYLTSLRRGS